MDRWKDPQDVKYLGLEAWQFDLAFFLVIGVVAVWLFLFGGVRALGILGNDEAPPRQVAAVEAVAPVASSVVQAPNSEDGEAPAAAPPAIEEPEQTPPPAPPTEPTSTPPPSPPPPEPTPTPEANCHSSYPSVCIPPPPPDLNCGDIPYTNIEVRHDVPDPDPHKLDRDKDGVACEG